MMRMIPKENAAFILIVVLLAIIVGVGYMLFGDDEDESLKLPAHPIEELKKRIPKDGE